ncbi:hypothetical protein J6590_035252 [Homalodisca vitripennis]|nr:hypothetical protein J6590_035252 [Homalodisca vitripennis]
MLVHNIILRALAEHDEYRSGNHSFKTVKSKRNSPFQCEIQDFATQPENITSLQAAQLLPNEFQTAVHRNNRSTIDNLAPPFTGAVIPSSSSHHHKV